MLRGLQQQGVQKGGPPCQGSQQSLDARMEDTQQTDRGRRQSPTPMRQDGCSLSPGVQLCSCAAASKTTAPHTESLAQEMNLPLQGEPSLSTPQHLDLIYKDSGAQSKALGGFLPCIFEAEAEKPSSLNPAGTTDISSRPWPSTGAGQLMAHDWLPRRSDQRGSIS